MYHQDYTQIAVLSELLYFYNRYIEKSNTTYSSINLRKLVDDGNNI